MLKMILEAAQYALSTAHDDKRNYLLGAVGVRSDGAMVHAQNGSVCIGVSSEMHGGLTFPEAHAERRLSRKLDVGSTVWVARVARSDGSLRNSRPCYDCMLALRSRKVKKVYYSINSTEYGCIDLQSKEFERTFKKKAKK